MTPPKSFAGPSHERLQPLGGGQEARSGGDFLAPRVRFAVFGGAALFLAVLLLAAMALIAQARRTAITDAERSASRFVSSAEASLNRNLLGIDILLAGVDEMLQLSDLVPQWIDPPQSARLMRATDSQHLLVGYLALMTPEGETIVSSARNGKPVELALPPGFLAQVMAQPVSTLTISAPVVSPSSSEPALYMARTVQLADSSRLIALAEVRVPLLASIMAQGVDIPGLQISLERSDGQLLASVPPNDRLMGSYLKPPLPEVVRGTEVSYAPSRLTQVPALLVARPTLYSNIAIAASVPLASALQEWETERNRILAVAALISLMIVATAGLALRYLGRLAQARGQILDGKAQLEATLDAMPDSLLELDLDGRYYSSHAPHPTLVAVAPGLFANGRVQDHLPAPAAQTINAALQEANQNGSTSGQQFALQHGTRQIWFELSVARKAPSPGQAPRFIVISRDITLGKEAAREIEQLAFYDPLTRLPNRRLLMDRLQHALASSARSGRLGALMFMDLDHFKSVNDTLGHDCGDILLQQVAARLRTSVREADTVARLGGDEFVIMLEDLGAQVQDSATQTELIGEQILEALNHPYRFGGHSIVSTPSIGATLFRGHDESMDKLLKQADIAMYQAKTAGRNALRFYDPDMQAVVSARIALEADLRTALAQQQFELYFQAQVAQDGRFVGAEGLIRWNHPVRGVVSPMEFIPLMEETGLILPVGLWVLKTACAQLKAWEQHPRLRTLELAVNVSARQFRDADFVDQVAQVLRDTSANAARLKLELTESLVLDNVHDTVGKMNQLKALGVRFSMDDFGTGQSSLSYLTQLPLDQLKIDQSFVRNIGVKATDSIIIQTIIGLASKLGMEVIAEGVETAEQRAFLLAHGCGICQGYLLGRPMPLAQFERDPG